MKKRMFYYEKGNVWRIPLYVLAFSLLTSLYGVSYANGQAKSISVQLKNVSLGEALKEIEKASGNSFFYDENKIDISHRVNLNAKNQSVYNVLNHILESTGLAFEVSNNQIVLLPVDKKTSTQPDDAPVVSGTQQQKKDPIDVFVGQDGAFSAKLFDGEYKMVTRDGNGPWVNSRDTTVINLNGSTHVELKVTPFFTISGEQISVSGSSMKASFMIHQVVPTAKINKVMLVLSKTQFADDVNNIFRKDITDVSAGSVSFDVDLSANKEVDNAKSLYGRVGVLPAGADQAVYSAVVKLK